MFKTVSVLTSCSPICYFGAFRHTSRNLTTKSNTKEVIPLQTVLEQAPEACVVRFDTLEEAEPLLGLFESIIQEQGWKPGTQLRAYPTSAVYFGLELNGSIVGGLQLVTGNADEGLPCLSVWPELALQGRSDVVDIALLAIDPKQRGQQNLFWLLCIEMWRYCRDRQINFLWVEVTPQKLHLYRRLGWPLEIAGPLRKHWGEECYPCVMTTEAVNNQMALKSAKSPSYQQVFQLMHRQQ